jgi:putative transposase
METNREREDFLVGNSDTLLDIEVCSSLTGKGLGRPYCTLLVDNNTESILGIHLSLDKPDHRSALNVLREYFHRHGKLPRELLIDGGKEFQHLQLDSTLSYFGIVKKTPTFASKVKVEKIFEQISQFLSKFSF